MAMAEVSRLFLDRGEAILPIVNNAQKIRKIFAKKRI